jgi:two-component system, chemotaxis family, protein-glutamate methylesterase/glutaminase
MAPIRVLVVDDSSVVRRIVTEVLGRHPEVTVVGTAANGALALAKLPLLTPDVLVLDLEMPEMDGLTTLTELRKTHPRLPVIIFSTLTERGAIATLEAFGRGASDYVTKPTNAGAGSGAQERIEQELLPKIKALGSRPTMAAPPAPIRPALAPSGRIEIVAIGVSTGGPNALAAVIPALPADFPLPIVVVQHMPPVFTRFLANRLDQLSPLSVREGEHNIVVAPGTVWIAPGDHHMVVAKEGKEVRLQLNQAPQENSCRPAVDPLFRSVASVYGGRALGVVLTGMGADGLAGARLLHGAGSQILAQDQATSVVWGMPGAVSEAGLASTWPLAAIADEILRRAAAGRAGPKVLTPVVQS